MSNRAFALMRLCWCRRHCAIRASPTSIYRRRLTRGRSSRRKGSRAIARASSLPCLSGLFDAAEVKILEAHRQPCVAFDSLEQELLLQHKAYGCISFWCATSERAYGFVFRPSWAKFFIPSAHLIYCADSADFVRFAGPIGRYLARRGRMVLPSTRMVLSPGSLARSARATCRNTSKVRDVRASATSPIRNTRCWESDVRWPMFPAAKAQTAPLCRPATMKPARLRNSAPTLELLADWPPRAPGRGVDR